MSQRWQCGKGHVWEAPAEEAATLSEGATLCPECGDTHVSQADAEPPPARSNATGTDATLNLDTGKPAQHTRSDATLATEGKPASLVFDATYVMSEASIPGRGRTVDLTAQLPSGETGGTLALEDQTAVVPPLPDQTIPVGEAAPASDRTLDMGTQGDEGQTTGLNDRTMGIEEAATLGKSGQRPDGTVAFGSAPSTRGGSTPDATMDIATGPGRRDDATAALYELGKGGPGPRRPPEAPGKQKRKGQLPTPEIAGYEILGELGRGAMGVVYKAKQIGLNRLVALKMILAGAHARPQELMRFKIEAEAIAQFQHPYIVQVYEIGEQNGCPYFSLEYLDGGCLADKLKGKPVPADEAARWVLQLAEAMDYAHRRGIMHRDLKPANVLLSKDGAPKITDFGLAKKFDGDSSATRDGAIMGTPSYMAPEQAAGKTKTLGPPADIYALGAILYDLLTGRPPFRGETVMETLQQVMNMEPTAPRKLQPKLPNDLNVICLKCLEKDPNKRYSSAGALADDLRRFLSDEPISARPVSRWERTVKWAKRRPAAASLVGVAALSLVGFITFILVLKGISDANAETEQQGRIREEGLRIEAQEGRKREEGQRVRAEDNFEYALEAVNRLLTRIGQERLAYEPRMEGLRRSILLDAKSFFDTFLKQKPESERLRWEAGLSQVRVADIEEMLGNYNESEKAYQAGAHLLGALCKEFPDFRSHAKYHRNLAVCYLNWGRLLEATGRRPQAEERFREAAGITDALVKAHPGNADHLLHQAKANLNWGAVLEKIGRAEDGEAKLGLSVAVLDSLVKADQNHLDMRQELVLALNNQAVVLKKLGKIREARKAYEQARGQLQAVAPELAQHPVIRELLGRTQKNLGVLLRDVDPAQSRYVLAEADVTFEILSREFPRTPLYAQERANVLSEIALTLQAMGAPTEAEPYAQNGDRLKRQLGDAFKSIPDYRWDLANSVQNRAVSLHTQGLVVEAEKDYREALGVYSKLTGEFPSVPQYHLDHAKTLVNLAVLLIGTNRAEAAKDLLKQAEERLKHLAAVYPDRPDYPAELARGYATSAGLLQVANLHAQAEPFYNRAIEMLTPLAQAHERVPDYAYHLAKAHDNCGNVRAALKQLLKAEADYREAIRILDRLTKDQQAIPLYAQQLASVHNSWARALVEDRTREPEIEDHFKKAIQILEELIVRFPEDAALRQDASRNHRGLAILYARQGLHSSVEKHFGRGLDVLLEHKTAAESTGPYAQDLIDARRNLSEHYWAQGNQAEARKTWDALLAIQDRRIKSQPKNPANYQDKARTLFGIADVEGQAKFPAEVSKRCRAAIATLNQAVQQMPQVPEFHDWRRMAYLQVISAELDQDRHEVAAGTADELIKLIPETWPLRRYVATFLLRAAQIAQADKNLPDDKKKTLVQTYTDRAMTQLDIAVRKGGYRDRNVLTTDPVFAPLRDRPEFKKLLELVATGG
jgi:serine/threonine protein kinase